jgi:hypothetical protein
MRRWILNVHLYGCLLSCAYLIILGWSSLCFNHPFLRPAAVTRSVTWEQPLRIDPPADNVAAADAVRDHLGLMGWPLPWTMKRDAEGGLHFEMERPGKSYTIEARFKDGKATVAARPKGFRAVVNSLHALEDVPNARYACGWGYYIEACTWFVLFAAVSGVYLWTSSKRERWIGAITFTVALAGSLGLILWVIWQG